MVVFPFPSHSTFLRVWARPEAQPRGVPAQGRKEFKMSKTFNAGVFVEKADGSMDRVGAAFANNRRGFNFTLDQVTLAGHLKVFPKKSERERLTELAGEQIIYAVEDYSDRQGQKRARWTPIGRGWVNQAGFNFILNAVPFPGSRMVSLPVDAQAA